MSDKINKIFCFTFAGGTADFYNKFDVFEDYGVDVLKMEYSGHGRRRNEPFYRNFDELSEDMISVMKQNIKANDRYAMFGYSMGSISVVSILQKIIHSGEINPPEYVFIAAHEPFFTFGNEDKSLDDFVKSRIIQLGGIPEKLISNKSFWRMYLPLYKADYIIIRDYNLKEIELKTDIPLTVFYSEQDTPLCKVKEWRKFFTGECQFEEYSGSHFFINEHYGNMINIIKERLKL